MSSWGLGAHRVALGVTCARALLALPPWPSKGMLEGMKRLETSKRTFKAFKTLWAFRRVDLWVGEHLFHQLLPKPRLRRDFEEISPAPLGCCSRLHLFGLRSGPRWVPQVSQRATATWSARRWRWCDGSSVASQREVKQEMIHSLSDLRVTLKWSARSSPFLHQILSVSIFYFFFALYFENMKDLKRVFALGLAASRPSPESTTGESRALQSRASSDSPRRRLQI